MPIIHEQTEAGTVIRLEGEVNISSAAELKTVLMEALGSGTELRVELDRAAELDVTALQLLCAAEREARELGSSFTLAGRLPDEISAALSGANFEPFPAFQKLL